MRKRGAVYADPAVARVDVLLLIDTLGSGGAQRQLCELAISLCLNGRRVHVLAYHSNDFHAPTLRAHGIACTISPGPLSRIARALFVWRAIRRLRPRAVYAYLNGASALAELARALHLARFRLIVSERHHDEKLTKKTRFRHFLHRFADAIVCNSQAQAAFVADNAPHLRSKVSCIRNSVDLERFHPVERDFAAPAPMRLVMLASHQRNKNPLALLEALLLVRECWNANVQLDWYGAILDGEIHRQSQEYIEKSGLSSHVNVFGPTDRVHELLPSYDALVLPSLSEACPNVVCEALACGVPVLASRVGDVAALAEQCLNGFLFDPQEPQSIASAIAELIALSPSARREMQQRNRARAEDLFRRERLLGQNLVVLQ